MKNGIKATINQHRLNDNEQEHRLNDNKREYRLNNVEKKTNLFGINDIFIVWIK